MKTIYQNNNNTIEIINGEIQVQIDNLPHTITFSKLNRDWSEMSQDQFQDGEDYSEGQYKHKNLHDQRTLTITGGTLKAKILQGENAGQTTTLSVQEIQNFENEQETVNEEE